MPVPADTFRVTWFFDLVVGSEVQEIAEFSWWMQPINQPTEPADWDLYLEVVAEQAADAWSDHITKPRFSSAVVLRAASAAKIAPDGSTQFRQDSPPNTPWQGGGSGSSLPWETAFAVSIYSYTPGTFIPHGRRRRGRFYLPPFDVNALDGSQRGELSGGNCNAILTEINAMYAALNEGSGSGGAGPGYLINRPVLGVCSRVANHFYEITDFRCDAKIDSQRRRQKSQNAGVYTQQAFS